MDARELTRDEKKKIRSLVTGMCANYDRESGLCLPLDCACYMLHKCWTGAYCRYFREAVLPLDPELQAALTTEGIACHLAAAPKMAQKNRGPYSGTSVSLAFLMPSAVASMTTSSFSFIELKSTSMCFLQELDLAPPSA